MGTRIAGACAAAALLGGCGHASRPTPTVQARERCAVTVPGGRVAGVPRGFTYGARDLAVVLWPRGVLVAGELPDGGSFADVGAGGSVDAKLGWWHETRGTLRITGERLDADAPPLRAEIPSGYGDHGFQATGVIFPTTGCWRVRGQVGRARLNFVTRVRTA